MIQNLVSMVVICKVKNDMGNIILIHKCHSEFVQAVVSHIGIICLVVPNFMAMNNLFLFSVHYCPLLPFGRELGIG